MRSNPLKGPRFMDIKKLKLTFPVHPFIFAIYPILFLYSVNLEEVYLSEIFSPILFSLGITIFIFFSIKFALNDIHKVAIITTFVLIMFYSYGHISNTLEDYEIVSAAQDGRYPFLLLIIFLVASSFAIIKLKSDINKNISKTLNILTIVLIISSITSIGNHMSHNKIKIFKDSSPSTNILGSKNIDKTESSLPDIYYIILDGYADQDTLREIYKFDNSRFTNDLELKGFYVAGKSQSNYALTFLSLASSLNMKQVIYLSTKLGKSKSRDIPTEMFRNNEVAKFLRAKGYEYINIGTTWQATTENPYADVLIHSQQRTDFNKIISQNSALRIVENYSTTDADTVLFALESLAKIPSYKQPTFTFAHIVPPHPPYLFDRQGKKLREAKRDLGTDSLWKQKEKYIDQLIFVNHKIEELVDILISKSKTQPIIILQADHGTATQNQFNKRSPKKLTKEQLKERFGILNAYYLPKDGSKALYETITPVNSFRKILNYYFKTNYAPLEDKSFFSDYDTPYEFIPADLKNN